jgi:hypothetical protein
MGQQRDNSWHEKYCIRSLIFLLFPVVAVEWHSHENDKMKRNKYIKRQNNNICVYRSVTLMCCCPFSCLLPADNELYNFNDNNEMTEIRHHGFVSIKFDISWQKTYGLLTYSLKCRSIML